MRAAIFAFAFAADEAVIEYLTWEIHADIEVTRAYVRSVLEREAEEPRRSYDLVVVWQDEVVGMGGSLMTPVVLGGLTSDTCCAGRVGVTGSARRWRRCWWISGSGTSICIGSGRRLTRRTSLRSGSWRR
jgi:hypothetical protein